jgi:hypothetical protein
MKAVATHQGFYLVLDFAERFGKVGIAQSSRVDI